MQSRSERHPNRRWIREQKGKGRGSVGLGAELKSSLEILQKHQLVKYLSEIRMNSQNLRVLTSMLKLNILIGQIHVLSLSSAIFSGFFLLQCPPSAGSGRYENIENIESI